MLSLFSSKERVALSYLQHSVEHTHLRSKRTDEEAGTIQSRMRHFCNFCHIHSIHDPCLPDKTQDERNFNMAMYASHLAMGNTLLSQSIKSNTNRLYLKAAAMLSEPRRLMNPLVSLSGSKSSWIEAIIQEQRRWESMPNRQEPVIVAMVLQVCKRAKNKHKDSFIIAFRDWLIIGMYTGNRKS